MVIWVHKQTLRQTFELSALHNIRNLSRWAKLGDGFQYINSRVWCDGLQAISAKHFNPLVAGLFIGSINTTRLVTLYACKPVGACRIFTQRTQCPSCTMGMNTKSCSGTCPRMSLTLLVCLYSWTQSGSTIQYQSDMCCGWVHPHMKDIHGPCRRHLSVGVHWLQYTFPDVNRQIQPSTKKLESVLRHNITTWEYPLNVDC